MKTTDATTERIWREEKELFQRRLAFGRVKTQIAEARAKHRR